MKETIDKEVLRESYPSNSFEKIKKEEPETRKLAKVTTGVVKKQKKGFMRRIAGTFLEEDGKSVGNYVMYDVIIPAIKNLVGDMVVGGVEMFLGGEKKGRNTRREGGRSVTSYGKFYKQSDRERKYEKRTISDVGRSRHQFNDIVMETRGEAEEVLSLLVDLTIDYDGATVADFYDLVGVESTYTDRKYGWDDLRGVAIGRVRGGGYVINFPRTILMD